MTQHKAHSPHGSPGNGNARRDFDVVVAGGGAAGLTAALAAVENGVSVLLAEARPTFRHGSNTAMSTAMIPAAGSRWQRELGIIDSPDLFLADVMRKTHGGADPTVARLLTSVAAEVVAWLNDSAGVPLELVTEFHYPGHSQLRCHTVPDRAGSTLHAHLLNAVSQKDRISLVVPLRLSDLLLDGDGSVDGAVLTRPDGTTETVRTAAVVLATNGYGANAEMIRRHIPEMSAALYFGGDGSTGDALVIGERLGADTGFLDAYQGHGSVATPHGVLVTWAVVVHGGMLVNNRGQRFSDETTGYSEHGRLVIAQPDAQAWMVFDKRIDVLCRPFADYQRCLDVDAVRWAADVPALSRLTATPVNVLSATLTVADACAHGRAVDPFGRVDWADGLSPPFAAIKVTGALFHTQGGLRVDDQAHVLRQGVAIPGLFAAGGAAVSMSGHGAGGYLAGNGLLPAFGLGYVAGRAAATRSASAPT